MMKRKNQKYSNPMNLTPHQYIQSKLMRHYDLRVMNNVHRSDFVECLVEYALEPDWLLTSSRGDYWAAWNCEHTSSGARIEIKHSAAMQIWNSEIPKKLPNRKFGIAPRKDNSAQYEQQSIKRLADIYVFAWHEEVRKEFIDQRDPNQWQFYVAAEQVLPKEQESILLSRLKSDDSIYSCSILNLKCVVENVCPEQASLKVELERALQS